MAGTKRWLVLTVWQFSTDVCRRVPVIWSSNGLRFIKAELQEAWGRASRLAPPGKIAPLE